MSPFFRRWLSRARRSRQRRNVPAVYHGGPPAVHRPSLLERIHALSQEPERDRSIRFDELLTEVLYGGHEPAFRAFCLVRISLVMTRGPRV